MDDWQQMAKANKFFEVRGVTKETITNLIEVLNSGTCQSLFPCLVIGGATGATVKPLQSISPDIILLDSSYAMTVFAQKAAYPVINADARYLPTASIGYFRTILITTGVLDFVNDQDFVKILKECYRIADDSTRLVVFLFKLPFVFKLLWHLGKKNNYNTRLKRFERVIEQISEIHPLFFKAIMHIPTRIPGHGLLMFKEFCEKEQLDYHSLKQKFPQLVAHRNDDRLAELFATTGWQITKRPLPNLLGLRCFLLKKLKSNTPEKE
jgi:ubiquinone/menaquinone biosynthesis C-methylase UbiE